MPSNPLDTFRRVQAFMSDNVRVGPPPDDDDRLSVVD
jgi:hypothetical protein